MSFTIYVSCNIPQIFVRCPSLSRDIYYFQHSFYSFFINFNHRIYKRETLGSEKRERHPENWTRERNVILNFRVTEEEKQKIEKRIELSGLSKQDFFISSCLYQNINVVGNVKSFNAIRKEMVSIENHLKSIATLDELELDKIESIRTIFEILDSYYRGSEQHLEI
mgnify:CR=1 FL=1